MKDFSKEIKAYALKNALEFGKADQKRILPKLFQHGLEKENISTIIPLITKTVEEINKLPKPELEKEFRSFAQYIKEEKEQKHELPELPNPSKNMVFRMAPYPSGALHIGNAKTYLLNALYAERYNAKLLLIMDDTIGSEEKQPLAESYSLIEEGFQWLSVNYEKPVIYKSDRLEIYYEYAEKLIEKGAAYVCHCSQEKLRKNRAMGKECECRSLSIEEQKNRWKKMFNEKEGEAVLRIKTSMQHPNPAFRDRVLFKISDRPHPRTFKKYRVWPTLEMSWAIDDHLLGVTHIIRGNDLMIETEMEKFIWDLFKWPHPVTIHVGLVTIKGIEAKISKSKAQKEIKSGEFEGWDDPRTWSLQSLRRRGIKPEAIKQFVKEIGLNKNDITIPIDSLYSINRKLIDLEANRYFFVEEPMEIKVKNIPASIKNLKEVEIPIHPDKKETRKVKFSDIFYLSKKDFQEYKGKEVRLLHLFNISLPLKENSAYFTSSENKELPKLQWVSSPIETEILMPDGKKIFGFSEKAIQNLKPNDVIQFERFGFCRFDSQKNKKYFFWFAHK